MNKKLVILGNGFDLHAGLSSNFQNFWNARWPDYEGNLSGNQVNEFFREMMMDSKTTAWDIIILYTKAYLALEKFNGLENWMDIESIIHHVLKPSILEDKSIGNKLYSNDLIASIQDLTINNGLKLTGFYDIQTESILALGEMYRRNLYDSKRKGGSMEDIASWLLSELNLFEDAFSTYLSKQVETSDIMYPAHCYEILAEINNYGISDSSSSSKSSKIDNLDVLSFNYTNPFLTLINLKGVWNNSYPVNNYRLIHGDLTNKIIFGFDSVDLDKSNSLITRFTKTSRLLDSSISNQQEAWSIDSSYDEIAIYGHSLSEADYSYFQSLFDYIDLYQCKTKLVFFFNLYDLSKSDQIKKKYEDSIIRLMSRYGASFDNKEKGRNLLHKLLLENRISIKELKITFS